MSLTVTRAKVKEMCGISTSDYDTPIDNLIADLVPVIEYGVKTEHLSGPSGLTATLNLGAAEVVAGEFIAQLARQPGFADKIQIGDLLIQPYLAEVPDPSGLKAQGWARLRPYLRVDPALPGFAPVSSAAGKRAEDEA